MRSQDARAKKSKSIQIADRRRLEALLRDLHLVARFREVNQGGDAMPPGQIPGGRQGRTVQGIHRVRRHGGRDERVALERRDERVGPREPFRGRFGVRHRKLDDGLPQDATQSRRPGFPGDLLLEVIHVRVGGRARLDHFKRGQPGARAHELRRHGLGFRGKDVLREPLHQGEVVGEPAEEHHGRVGVRIDQARQHHLAGRVDGLGTAEPALDGAGRIDRHDVGPVNRHRAVGNDASTAIHRYHRAVGDDERDLPLTRLCRRDHQRDGYDERHREDANLHGRILRRTFAPGTLGRTFAPSHHRTIAL